MNEKILVVDDEKSIVDILKFNLQKEGGLSSGSDPAGRDDAQALGV